MSGKKSLLIAFVMDDRLSREKTHIVARALNLLRQEAQLEILPGETTEVQLLAKLQAPDAPHYHAILAPYYKYLTWTRFEAHLGLTRSTGPAFAGYFADPLSLKDLGAVRDGARSTLLDFAGLEAPEAISIVRSLAYENRRAGLRPFLEPQTPIYVDTWMGGQTLGPKLDAVCALPEIAGTEWARRLPALRQCLTALWGQIYDEGPGKGDHAAKAPKAYFQVAADSRALALRLCYSMTGVTAKEALAQHWPDASRPFAAGQLLVRSSDLVRVHTIADSTDIEVTALLLPSKPSELSPQNARTLWCEPLSASLIAEGAYEMPGELNPGLRLLPQAAGGGQGPSTVEKEERKAKDRLLFDAAVKIKELKALLAERDDQLRELRSGGVGTAPPLPPPDAENLLEAFQDRYQALKDQMRALEAQAEQAREQGVDPKLLEGLKLKLQALSQREKAWLQQIAVTFEIRKKA